MNKFPLTLLTFGFILSACASGAEAPTNAPAATSGVAITQQSATLSQTTATATSTPVANDQSAVTPLPAATAAATLGGPVVVTVEPANGTPPAGGNTVPAVVPTPIPTLASGLKPSELKFRVLAAFPDFFYCDPDVYPVASADEAQLAEQRLPAIQANTEEYQAILAHLSLAGPTLSADQKLLVYQAYKQLAAIRFTLTGDKYQFQLATKDAAGKGLLITGLIDGQGAITNQQSQPTVATCPV